MTHVNKQHYRYGDGLSLHQRGFGGMSGVLLLKEIFRRYEVQVDSSTSSADGSQSESQISSSNTAVTIVPWFLASGERAIAKHPDNVRGQQSNESTLKASVRDKGVMWSVGENAFFLLPSNLHYNIWHLLAGPLPRLSMMLWGRKCLLSLFVRVAVRVGVSCVGCRFRMLWFVCFISTSLDKKRIPRMRCCYLHLKMECQAGCYTRTHRLKCEFGYATGTTNSTLAAVTVSLIALPTLCW